MSFHVNEKGVSGVCDAKDRDCPYENFDTEEEAIKAYERKMEIDMFRSHRERKQRRKKFRASVRRFANIGGALFLTFNVASCASTLNGPTSRDLPDDSSDASIESVTQKVEEGLTGVIRSGGEVIGKVLDGQQKARPESGKGARLTGRQLDVTPAEVKAAKEQLRKIEVAPESNVEYRRADQFGKGFRKYVVGKVEHRDVLPGSKFESSSPRSRVVEGKLLDPYTGKIVNLTKKNKSDADVDHIVPLSEAAQSGALEPDRLDRDPKRSDAAARNELANDLDNLSLVSSRENRSKSDSDPSEWMVPNNSAARCRYAVQYIAVKDKYHLKMDKKEVNALSSTLERCE